MIEPSRLKDLLTQPHYSRAEKLLICLAVDPGSPKKVQEVKQIAIGAGLRAVRRWNVSSILSVAGAKVARIPQGWQLTSVGLSHVASLVGPVAASPALAVASSLRSHSAKLTDPDVRAFVEEAIACFELKQYRAAIVFSWVGAVALMYALVIANHLADFNREAPARDARWRPAKTADDLARMKEADFLVVLERCSILGKSVRQELEGCLKLRNGCGHPNSLKVGEAKTAAHIETLIQNVFSRFA